MNSSSVRNLSPFGYQVAGHGALLRASGNKLCKPTVGRELWFYRLVNREQVHKELLRFIPRFFGCIRIPATRVFAAEQTFMDAYDVDSDVQDTEADAEGNTGAEASPWSVEMHEAHLESACDLTEAEKLCYIVVEDMTSSMESPSVIDIKLGHRQHPPGATAKKIRKQMEKVANTTSKEMGIRICGMQRWSLESHAYSFVDKYAGRALTRKRLPICLANFFHNGLSFQVQIAKACAEKVQDMVSMYEAHLQCFRFYSASLLIVCDFAAEDVLSTLHVKLIDFANTFPLEEGMENDDGVHKGLMSLRDILQDIGERKYLETYTPPEDVNIDNWFLVRERLVQEDGD